MDVSKSVEKTVHFLLKKKPTKISVFTHPPSNENLNRFVVVINLTIENIKLKSSATSSSHAFAAVKAISEIGEDILRTEKKLGSRSGISGGFIKSEIINRAKSELIEHDAFFFHYHNKIPFTYHNSRILNEQTLHTFILSSKSKMYKTILVINEESLEDNNCLIFATSAHSNLEIAIEKAICEFSQKLLNHLLWPEDCAKLENELIFHNKSDLHHKACRSPINKEIFKKLCCKENISPLIDRGDTSTWEIEKLSSPLEFFNFYKITSMQLIPIYFGIPEEDQDENALNFHPYW